MAAMIRGILFDKDGTLLDFDRTWVSAYRAAAAAVVDRLDLGVTADALLAAAGMDPVSGRCAATSALGSGSNADIATVWAARAGVGDPAPLLDIIEHSFSRETLLSLVPVTDLAPVFTALRAGGLKLGIATMDSEALAWETVRRFALEPHLDFVCGYDSGHGVKPGPGMVNAFCHHCRLAPPEVAMIGDTPHDLEMGRAAGAGLVVGVLSGAGTRETLAPLADHVIEDITALRPLLSPAG